MSRIERGNIEVVAMEGEKYGGVSGDDGNKNSLSHPTKEVKYHYHDEITVITW